MSVGWLKAVEFKVRLGQVVGYGNWHSVLNVSLLFSFVERNESKRGGLQEGRKMLAFQSPVATGMVIPLCPR